MIWFSLFIPFFISIIVYFVTKNKHPNKTEILLGILFIPTITIAFVILIMSLIMENYNQTDTEYLSYHITKIRHEDDWNERVRVRKTRTTYDSDGKPHEETYHTYETRYHPEEYFGYLNNNKKINITIETYDCVKNRWNVPMKFIDMHRKYYTIDGDAQEYHWDGNKNTIKTYVVEHSYVNKIIGSQSAFKFNEVTEKEAKILGLYEYPKIEGHEQNPIVGYNKFVSRDDIHQIQMLNGFYGQDKEITFFILIYPNTAVSIVEDQRSYWQGGNKNEFVICVGVDSLTNNVQWAQCFSWLDDTTMEIECSNFINKQKSFNVKQLGIWLENNLHLWKRKEFNDFDYLNVTLSGKQEIGILWTVIILSIAFGIFLVQKFW